MSLKSLANQAIDFLKKPFTSTSTTTVQPKSGDLTADVSSTDGSASLAASPNSGEMASAPSGEQNVSSENQTTEEGTGETSEKKKKAQVKNINIAD